MTPWRVSSNPENTAMASVIPGQASSRRGAYLAFMYTSYTLIARKIHTWTHHLDKARREVYSKRPTSGDSDASDRGFHLLVSIVPSLLFGAGGLGGEGSLPYPF